jgi:hypothetical protein
VASGSPVLGILVVVMIVLSVAQDVVLHRPPAE